jgi:hypothetical protein
MRGARAVAGSDEHRVPLRMPGRSGPANGRESTADENVPVPGPPFVESSPCPGMSGTFPAQINSAPPSRGSPVSKGRWVQDEQVAAMTDEEILALYRQTRTNPYLTLSTAKALHGLELMRAEPERWNQRQDPEAN